MTNIKSKVMATLAGVVVVAGCSSNQFDIQNTNAPTVEATTGTPTKLTLARLAVGVAQGLLADVGPEITTWGAFGREDYNLLGNDPRTTTETIAGPLDPGGVGGGQWGKYASIRTINIYLAAVDKAADMTAAEKAASKGYAQTLQAVLFHRLLLRNASLGIPVDVAVGLDQPPAPFLTQANAYNRIISLLDDARTNLAGGGAAFPFTMPPGYTGFDTPANFIKFNRGYFAKVQNHRATFVGGGAAAYQAAITALSQSFVDPAGSLGAGVSYAYSSASGEPANPVTEPLSAVRFYIHHSIRDAAQFKTNGVDKDDRYVNKTRPVAPRTQNNLTETLKPIIYNKPGTFDPDLDADVPLLKNEELILLRAEARWFTGDKANDLADINAVRTRSGGLPNTSLTPGSADPAFVTELMYNRRYSLLFEQGTSWHDARRFGRQTDLPRDRAGDTIFPYMTIPAGECDARGLVVPCTPPTS